MSAPKKRKVADAVLEALETARAELEERESSLKQREEALRKAIEGVEHEKRLMASRKPSDVLPINVGGTKLSVLRSTLCQFESSLLAAKFSGRWDANIEKDADGAFFIDHPIELMLPLINYLRDKAIAEPSVAVDLPHARNAQGECLAVHEYYSFRRLVEYYGMTPFVYQQAFQLWRGDKAHSSSTCGPEPAVYCKVWNTYQLCPVGHSRCVKSFEIILGASIERVQVGWASIHCGSSFTPGRVKARYFPRQLGPSERKGVGEEGASIALDAHHGGVKCAGEALVTVPQLTIQAGSVLTCKRTPTHYKWLVDGVEKAAISVDSIKKKISTWHGPSDSQANFRPFISALGEWRVAHFTYHSEEDYPLD